MYLATPTECLANKLAPTRQRSLANGTGSDIGARYHHGDYAEAGEKREDLQYATGLKSNASVIFVPIYGMSNYILRFGNCRAYSLPRTHCSKNNR